MIAEKNGDPGEWIKQLCLNVGVNGYAAVRKGVPEREDTLPYAPGYIGCQGKMKGLKVERDVPLWIEQNTEKKYYRLHDQQE